jgi:hypothetical protein
MRIELEKGRAVSFGYRVDRRDARDYLYAPLPAELPVRVDNRELVVRIMNQNPEGACPGHAVCLAAEFHYWARLGQKVDLSQRWAYRRAREEDPWIGENYHGSTLRAAVKAWAKYGICDEGYGPWDPYPISEDSPDFNLVEWEGEPNAGSAQNALQYPLQTYRRCHTEFDTKHAIHEHGIAIVGATVHSGWNIWGTDVIHYDDTIHDWGGHAFALVGFDESEKIYHVANSWGEEWGENGFAKYSYDDAKTNIHDAWVVSVPLVD